MADFGSLNNNELGNEFKKWRIELNMKKKAKRNNDNNINDDMSKDDIISELKHEIQILKNENKQQLISFDKSLNNIKSNFEIMYNNLQQKLNQVNQENIIKTNNNDNNNNNNNSSNNDNKNQYNRELQRLMDDKLILVNNFVTEQNRLRDIVKSLNLKIIQYELNEIEYKKHLKGKGYKFIKKVNYVNNIQIKNLYSNKSPNI